jgi:hypothetical protein
MVRADATQDTELTKAFDCLLPSQDQISLACSLSPKGVDVASIAPHTAHSGRLLDQITGHLLFFCFYLRLLLVIFRVLLGVCIILGVLVEGLVLCILILTIGYRPDVWVVEDL